MTLDIDWEKNKLELSKVAIVDDWLNKNFRVQSTKKSYISSFLLFCKSVYKDEIPQDSFDIDYNNYVSRYLNEQRNFKDDFKAFILYLSDNGYAPSYIHTKVAKIRKFFSRHGHRVDEEEWDDIKKGLMPANVIVTKDKILTKDQCKMVLTHLSVLGKAMFLFLLATGCRIGETIQLKVDDFDMEHDPPTINIRAQYTKGGVGGRTMWFTYETKNAILEWWKVKDERQKRGGQGEFGKDLAFGVTAQAYRHMFYEALDKAGLGKRDPSTKTKIRIYHVHTTRKFFKTNMTYVAKLPTNVVDGWMGHKAYLGEAYDRPEGIEADQLYKKHMEAVTIYGSMPSDFAQKLEAMEKESKAKDDELRKVDEMLDKLGIDNDRSREERLLEYFRITQTRETTQPTKTELPTIPRETKSSEVSKPVYDPKEHAKLDAQVTEKKEWICVRGLPRHPNPEMQKARCETCRVNHWSEWKACQELRLKA